MLKYYQLANDKTNMLQNYFDKNS